MQIIIHKIVYLSLLVLLHPLLAQHHAAYVIISCFSFFHNKILVFIYCLLYLYILNKDNITLTQHILISLISFISFHGGFV